MSSLIVIEEQRDEQTATSTPGMNSPNPESNEAALLALALRLLDRREQGALTAEAAQLLVGQLPARLPLKIPLPKDSRVVGSLVRSQKQTTIVLDTDQSPERVLDFYRERLQADGWSTPERYRLGGFEPAHVANYVLFCRGSRGPALWVEAYKVRDSLTGVRLQLETNPRHSPCACVHGDV